MWRRRLRPSEDEFDKVLIATQYPQHNAHTYIPLNIYPISYSPRTTLSSIKNYMQSLTNVSRALRCTTHHKQQSNQIRRLEDSIRFGGSMRTEGTQTPLLTESDASKIRYDLKMPSARRIG
ncbi:hypothetical protein M514_02401 [Trichuris suis]|uniref:Uncharacterized protein n=1 Tax=Trichuris suis TaxID=68888 RepID=A0A085MHM8_9BILA|nr:hypothetical protein M513_02401 [Trichuris suis]KFD64826.1 hypothetical protein M514_02401 [Trichuris suis]